ncbi:MAG TPA: OmpA family protein [Candidatus Polarisedimenticolia bacterium]|nr:OmpA family protein [Candidatus Polarisedimenticolia bacterium]
MNPKNPGALLGTILCFMAAGFIGATARATAASTVEPDFVYTSPATIEEAQGILKRLGHLRAGAYERGVVDASTRDALMEFQRTHTLRPTGRVDGETLTQLLQHGRATGGGALVLKGVYFDTGSARLDGESLRVLDQVARSLKANPRVVIGISGHSDSTGAAAFNRQLSKARADAVRAYLISKGVSASRLETRAYGSRQPIADNDTRAGRAENRRVELEPLS